MINVQRNLDRNWDGFCTLIYQGNPLCGYVEAYTGLHGQFISFTTPRDPDFHQSETVLLNKHLVEKVTPLAPAKVMDLLFPHTPGRRHPAAAKKKGAPAKTKKGGS